MTGFDLAIIGVVVLSAAIAFFRGIVRSMIGLIAWIAGFVAGLTFAPVVATWLPAFPDYPLVPYVLAFVIIFLLTIVAGALIAWPLHAVIHKAGLGFVDRGLGLAFGVLRGVVVVLAFVLIGGLSPLVERQWWQNSLLAPPFEEAAMSLRSWMPPSWAERLRFPDRSGGGPMQKVSGGDVPDGIPTFHLLHRGWIQASASGRPVGARRQRHETTRVMRGAVRLPPVCLT